MLALLLELLRIAVADPTASSVLGAAVTGHPELAPELVRICRRESHCRLVGAHEGDAWASGLMYRKAKRVGWLDSKCPFYRAPSAATGRFSTRGVHGLSAAYSLRFLGSCWPPEALDIPLISAIAAARRAHHQCQRHGACSAQTRHRHWTGAAKYDRRAHEQLHKPAL